MRSAFAIATLVTLIAVIIGWLVLDEALPPDRSDPDSGNGFAYLAWTIVISASVGPVTAWMVVTYRWRRLPAPPRSVRIMFAAALLLVPAFILAAILDWFIGDRVNRDVQGVALPIALACGVIGVLVTGRVLRARFALAGVALIAAAGVAVCTTDVVIADSRLETRIRNSVHDSSRPLALPGDDAGWSVTERSVRDEWGPVDEIGDPTRPVASGGLVDAPDNAYG